MNRLPRAIKRVRKRFARSRGAILMYHRVATADIDPWRLSVTPQHFAEHLQILRSRFTPMALPEFVRANGEGTLPKRAVAITFDDGYADNLYNALPLLEKYGIPATVFVATGYLGKERGFWWDELARALLRPGKLPEKLSLTIGEKVERWEPGTAADYREEDFRADRDRAAWTALPGSRLHFYHSLWQKLLPLPEDERRERLREIDQWAGTTARADSLPLDIQELERLGKSERIEIGAHTLTHPLLPARSIAEQQIEIRASKERLEEILDRPVTGFSYPFGGYTPETIEIVRSAGFDYACSTAAEIAWRESDRFRLPRLTIENRDGDEFAQQLARWFTDG